MGVFTAVVVIEYVGPIVLGALAGSLTDRFNAALLCMWSAVVATAAMCVFLLVPGTVPAAAIALGAVINLVRPFYRAGIFAAGARSVASDELAEYNVRWAISVQAGQIMGGAAAGATLSTIGPTAAFGVAAITFAGSALSMWVARGKVRSTSSAAAADRSGWLAMLRELLGQPRQAASLLLIGADFVAMAAFTVALAPLVDTVFGDAVWLGILDAVFAVGAIVVAALGLGRRRTTQQALRRAVSLGLGIQVVGMIALAVGAVWSGGGAVAVCLGALLLGAGVAVSSSQQVTLLQRTVTEDAVGKAGALRQAVIGLVTAVTLPIIGIALGMSLAAAYLLVGAILLLGIVVNVLVARVEPAHEHVPA